MKIKKKTRGANKHQGFRLIPDTSGDLLKGIYVKDDISEIIIESTFGFKWHYRPLKDDEDMSKVC